MHKVKITNPHAAVIVWNYSDRVNADGAKNVHDIEEIVVTSGSLMSISTSKRKSSPAGSFEFRLAPTFNWTARFTPGSWCVILMSQDKPVPQISAADLGFADPDLVKMLGRIDSVRLAVEVDQETGARMSQYVVTGQDWCSVFDTKLYIDPIVRNNNFEKLSAVGHAARLGFDNFITEWTDDKHAALPTSSQTVDAMIKLWGAPILDLSNATGVLGGNANPIQLDSNIIFSSEAQFKLPVEVAKYLMLGDLGSSLLTGTSVNFSKVISRYDGVLNSYDSYSGDNMDSNGFPDPASMYKVNSFWQILTDNCNPLINELVTDMRWENGKPKLALYKRVKPFLNRSNFEGSDQPQVQRNASKFSNVRRIKIDLEDVISINAGTNWRDKFNFIEIRPQPQLNQANFDTMVKAESQSLDRKAFERDGFKPLMQTAYYMPFNGSEPAPLEALQWKYLMREWYFNTHLMLNGACTIIGQNQYIQVGDNIQIDASILGPVDYNSYQSNDRAFLTAHVEAVNHTFTITADGARSFSTSIQFVRGVITKEDGTIFGNGSGAGFATGDSLDAALDRDGRKMTNQQERNRRTIGTSSISDPDKNNKFRGT